MPVCSGRDVLDKPVTGFNQVKDLSVAYLVRPDYCAVKHFKCFLPFLQPVKSEAWCAAFRPGSSTKGPDCISVPCASQQAKQITS